MRYKIRMMESAQADMRDIYRYICVELKSPAAAVRRVKDIEKAVRSLEEMPCRISLVADDYLASKGLRTIAVKTHLVRGCRADR